MRCHDETSSSNKTLVSYPQNSHDHELCKDYWLAIVETINGSGHDQQLRGCPESSLKASSKTDC